MNPEIIFIHHSLTKDSGTVSWGAIEDYHTKTLRWSAIGYHAGIELARDRYQVLMGRPWDVAGAHVSGHNSDSLGICFVGNYDEIEPPVDMLSKGAQIVSLWLRLFHLTPDDVIGHRDINPNKTCPGKQFDLEKFRKMLWS